MSKTSIRPSHFFAANYEFFDESGSRVAQVGMPLWAKLLRGNLVTVQVGDENYELVDAATVADRYAGGGQRSTKTYIHSGGSRLVELDYRLQGSNESFVVSDLATSKSFNVKREGFGNFEIFEGASKVGTLKNSDMLFRKAFLDLSSELPTLVQVAIFWGSINNQEIRL